MTGAEPPVTPDPGPARDWLQHELAKPEYHQGQAPGFLTRIGSWIRDLLDAISSGTGLPAPAVLLGFALVLVALIGVAVYLYRPRLQSRAAAGRGQIFDSPTELSAAAHRQRAEAAAGAGDYDSAVLESFRAMVRQGEERLLVEPAPARTASEFATELGGTFGELAPEITGAADLFSRIRYSRQGAAQEANSAQYEWIKSLEARVRTASASAYDGERSWAGPR